MASVKKLILASQSPFRRQLLAAVGLQFAVEPAPVDEAAIAAATPAALAEARAMAKGLAVAALHSGALVIGADQVLSLSGRPYDKAPDAATASRHLQQLSGQTHILHSAVSLCLGPRGAEPARVVAAFRVDTAMPMRQLSAAEIEALVASGEWQGSVGCYRFEGLGIQLFETVAAEQTAIIGLPMQPLCRELRRLGLNPLLQAAPPWTCSV